MRILIEDGYESCTSRTNRTGLGHRTTPGPGWECLTGRKGWGPGPVPQTRVSPMEVGRVV